MKAGDAVYSVNSPLPSIGGQTASCDAANHLKGCVSELRLQLWKVQARESSHEWPVSGCVENCESRGRGEDEHLLAMRCRKRCSLEIQHREKTQ